MIRLLSAREFLAYVTLTNYVAVLGGVFLWVAFFVLGLIARRLERAFETPTHWRMLLWAPSGILLYTVSTLVQAGASAGTTPAGAELVVAYGLLALSGAGCLLGCWTTYALLAALARPGGTPS
ncbi:MAG: hypothetical protein AAB368_04605 [bacterium]